MMFSVWMDGSWVRVCAEKKPAEGRQVEVRKRRSLQGRREEAGVDSKGYGIATPKGSSLRWVE